MSRVIQSQGPTLVLRSAKDVQDYLLAKIARADKGLTGLEQEMFVTLPDGRPPAFDKIEAVLNRMAAQLPDAKAAQEKGRTVAVSCPLGDVCLEPGGQIELSSAAAPDLATVMARQRGLMDALEQAAAAEGLKVQGAGHLPAFTDAALVPRSRFAAYAEYCRTAHGDKAEALLETMKSCTGLQVNVDPMGEEFHEIYRALLVLEIAGCLRDRTVRQQRFAETYAPLFPRQVAPLFNALAAKDNVSLVEKITERLLSLHMPFVPDPGSAEGFLPSAQVYGAVPTVGELMARGVLTAGLLDNALSLQMTMPNLRRHGVVETRAPDTPETLDGVAEVARRYHAAAYDRPTRAALVRLGQGLEPGLLSRAFDARFRVPEEALMAMPVGSGLTVGRFIESVQKRV